MKSIALGLLLALSSFAASGMELTTNAAFRNNVCGNKCSIRSYRNFQTDLMVYCVVIERTDFDCLSDRDQAIELFAKLNDAGACNP